MGDAATGAAPVRRRLLALHLFDAGYWRRRVLAVKGRFELTERQLTQLEKILRRLGSSAE
ncbi:hypothetical protein [Paraburkholderia sp. Cpub6]|uniref:hypothetical protein n=1 Tax=Paraburkholderia sp. Cpub6 TaxID=2723094 RepID=UPI0018341978|nr:hypothetical protein [Paraburkholderia sp. Cpub6]